MRVKILMVRSDRYESQLDVHVSTVSGGRWVDRLGWVTVETIERKKRKKVGELRLTRHEWIAIGRQMGWFELDGPLRKEIESPEATT